MCIRDSLHTGQAYDQIKTVSSQDMSLLRNSRILVQFVVYCVLFVMTSTNTEKKSAVKEGHVLTAHGFYLVVSLASMQIKSFWNPFSKIKLLTYALNIYLIQVHDQQGLQ